MEGSFSKFRVYLFIQKKNSDAILVCLICKQDNLEISHHQNKQFIIAHRYIATFEMGFSGRIGNKIQGFFMLVINWSFSMSSPFDRMPLEILNLLSSRQLSELQPDRNKKNCRKIRPTLTVLLPLYTYIPIIF